MQPARASNLASLSIFGLAISLAFGCQPKPEATPAKPANQAAEDSRSIYRQAIDQAKSLEKRINDRAIDPEEKARLEGGNLAGQNQ